MAQTKKKRRRKHRGTQGGGIDRGRGGGRPRSKEEARARARRRSQQRPARGEAPPTWRSAINRALLGGAVFFGLTLLLFGKGVGEAAMLSIVMVALYVPLGFYIDRFFYRRRRAREIAARQAEKQAKGRR